MSTAIKYETPKLSDLSHNEKLDRGGAHALLVAIDMLESHEGSSEPYRIGMGERAAGDRLLRGKMIYGHHDRKTLRHGEAVRLTAKGARALSHFIVELADFYREGVM